MLIVKVAFPIDVQHRSDKHRPTGISLTLRIAFLGSINSGQSNCLTHSVQDALLCARSPPPPFDEMRISAHGNCHDCTPRCAFKDANITDKEPDAQIDSVSDSCDTCDCHRKVHSQPAVFLPLAEDFNDYLALDLKFLNI